MTTYPSTESVDSPDAIYNAIVIARDFAAEDVDDVGKVYFDYLRQEFVDGADHAHVDTGCRYEPAFCAADLVTCQGEDSPAAAAARRWTINVCEECYLAHAGVLESVPGGYLWEPLSLLGGLDLHDGCTECPPCEGCRPEDDGPAPYCQCQWGHRERGHGFHKEPCQGCGATWAGNRYPLVVEPKRINLSHRETAN